MIAVPAVHPWPQERERSVDGASSAEAMPLWSRASADEAAFAEEQRRLGAVWSFLLLTSDLPRDGDWVRTRLGGKSIFVQRFGDEFRAFENRCAHRFYPLRTSDKGNGPVVCGFHHWRYDKDGLARGIPHCKEIFGVTPRELDARLRPVEIACCGAMIFGRFVSEGDSSGETLEVFLGDFFPVLAAMCPPGTKPLRRRFKVASNWKLNHHIGLDDYHIVAIHPTTFGKQGYVENKMLHYARVGPHSAYLWSDQPDAMRAMARDCANGTFRPKHYVTINLFPTLIVSQYQSVRLFGAWFWYVTIIRYVPLSAGESGVETWRFPSPFPLEGPPIVQRWRGAIDRILQHGVAYYEKQVIQEDNVAVGNLQTIARQLDGEPIIGAQEMRIVWFEQAYARAMAGIPLLPWDPEPSSGEPEVAEPVIVTAVAADREPVGNDF